MKKQLTLSLVAIGLSCLLGFAQTPQKQRSDRKIIEIEKIIELTDKQEKQIRKAYDDYNVKADYALFEVADPQEAQRIKKEANKEFNETFFGLLSDDQKERYETITGTSTKKKEEKRSDRKIIEIKKIIDINDKQEKQIRKAYDNYNVKVDHALFEVTDPAEVQRIKKEAGKEFNETLLSLLSPGQRTTYEALTGTAKEKTEKQRSDRRINEIKNVIDITPAQEKQIRKAYDKYNEQVDNALENESDPYKISQVKYEANKEYNETFMKLLSNSQKNTYIRVMYTPEITAKTEGKVDLLRESGEYTAEELAVKHKEIFEYLMAEKVVYARDKHDYKKQKENIGKLKMIQPKSLKESNTREKLQAQGKLKRGKVNW